MHIKLTNGVPETYTIGQLRRDNPQVSFPKSIPDDTLAEYDVYPLTPTDRPQVDHTKNVAEAPAQQINGVWTQAWAVTNATPEQIAERTTERANSVRSDRNARLAACDWTQLADAPVDSLAWANYRQALRDVTAQAGFPWSVEWPSVPA
jgi:hypothetical protein